MSPQAPSPTSTPTSPAPLPPPPVAAPKRTYRPIGRLAGWLEGVTASAIVISLTLALAAQAGVEVRGDLVSTPDGVQALLIAEVVLVVALRVLTHVWTYRAVANAEALGAAALDYSPASSIWWWYVPIAALFKPAKMLNQLAKASDPDFEYGTNRWMRNKPSELVGGWWTAYLFLAFGGQLVLGIGLDSSAARGALVLLGLGLASTLGLWWAVVRRITRLQRHRAVRLARAGVLPEALRDHRRT